MTTDILPVIIVPSFLALRRGILFPPWQCLWLNLFRIGGFIVGANDRPTSLQVKFLEGKDRL